MWRNYLTTAWRNLKRHKLLSLIHLVGLAIGTAASMLILHYATFELSYDRFHTQADNLYRVTLQHTGSDGVLHHFATSYAPAGPALKQAFPEVEDFTRLYYASNPTLLRVGNRAFNERLVYADSSFLQMFSYPLRAGDPQSALAAPNTVVITQSVANKYFGEQNPMGQFIRMQEGNLDVNLQVTAVLEDIPANTHLPFQMLVSFKTFLTLMDASLEQNWAWKVFYTYLQVDARTSGRALEAKLPAIIERYNGQYLKGIHAHESLRLQALPDIHLHSDLIREAGVNGTAQLVYILLVIALFILAIAWVNYINLSTAKALERAKEIGIRKVTGANRFQLIRQFVLESFWLNLLATLTALVLVEALLPAFGSFLGQAVPAQLAATSWLALGGILIVGTLATGVYPALVLSSFQPIEVLKGRFRSSLKGTLIRKGLVVGQFMASVVLITGTFTVYRQIQFMRQADLGMNLDQLLVVEAPVVVKNFSTYAGNLQTLRNEVAALPGVRGFTATDFIPGQSVMESWSGYIRRLGVARGDARTYNMAGIDYAFIPTLGFQLLAGRNFSRDFPTDSAAVILTAEATRQLGFPSPQAAIGQRIIYPHWGEDNQASEVVGVVGDFHFQSLKNAYAPIIFGLSAFNRSYYLLRVSPGHLTTTLAALQARYQERFPENRFAYFFLDERFNRQYQGDRLFGKVFGLFTGLAILIACLGLFGLTAFSTMQRTKEIGVRKVLGASVSHLLYLLSRDFVRLILLANVLAWPIAGWAMSRWLSGYAFRIELTAWLFVGPSALVLTIALLTMSLQTWQAAQQNPVKALRYE